MEFLKFIRSLEELLYEVMTWLLFYPRTLWRAMRHPLALSSQAEAEMVEPAERQFLDLVSPPLFLMLTILLTHGLEIGLHQTVATPSTEMGRALLASETNLLVFRAIAWSFFPLLMASTLLLKQKRPIDRDTLRRPFFLQCLFAAPFVVGIALATALGRLGYPVISAVLACTAIIWYLTVQTRWFRSRLQIHSGRALALALAAFGLAVVVDIAIAWAIFGLGA